MEETPAVSLWAGWIGPLAPVRLGATRLADESWHFAGWPDRLPFEPSALVLVADPFTFPADQFLAWLAQRHPGLPVVGGNASGGLRTRRDPAGRRCDIATDGAGGRAGGAGIDVEALVSQGCRPFGQPLTVTRSDRNIIYEVAGQPAIKCLVAQITRGP